MRRSCLALVVAALVVPLTPALATSTEAATEVRHYLDADRIGTVGNDRAEDVSAGHTDIAVAGTVEGALPGQVAAGGTDAFVRFLRDNLTPRWTRQFGSSADDTVAAVDTNPVNVIVGGSTEGALAGTHLGGTDAWVRVLDETGDELWKAQFGGPGDDAVTDVDRDGFGGYYASGSIDGAAFVRKHDGTGGTAWDGQVDGDAVSHVIVAKARVVVVEMYAATFRLAVLDQATGLRVWRTPPIDGRPVALTTSRRHLYVGGTTVDGEPEDAFLASYTFAGGFRWSRQVLGVPGSDWLTAATWDGRAVIASVGDAQHGSDALVAFSPNGRRRWIVRTPGDFVVTGMSRQYGPLLASGYSSEDVGGPGVGGEDALVARFVTYQPDIWAYIHASPRDAGHDVYAGPQELVVPVLRDTPTQIFLQADNDGEVAQRLRVRACGSKDGFRLRYTKRDVDVTDRINRGMVIGPVPARFGRELGITIRRGGRTAAETRCPIVLKSVVTGETDRMTLVLRRRG